MELKSVDAFSETEQQILRLLASHGRLDTLQLVKLVYKKNPPTCARNSMSTILNKLFKRTNADRRRGAIKIGRSPRFGPHPTIYWIK